MFTTITMSFEEVAKAFNISVEEARITAMKSGGFGAIHVTEDLIKMHTEKFGAETVNNVFKNGPGSYIIVSSSFIEIAGLSSEEVSAILAHEEGHVVHEHVTSSEAAKAREEGKHLNVADFELEADRYAAARFGREVMRSALSKVIYTVAKAASELDEEEKDNAGHFDKVHAVMLKSVQYRLDALAA